MFHGGISDERCEQVKAAFNADLKNHPLRILIATDAAREGVNLQNYCADLFNFDVPWNPSRMEQRNGRIDRKLQKADLVRDESDTTDLESVEKGKVIGEELGAIRERRQTLLDQGKQLQNILDA